MARYISSVVVTLSPKGRYSFEPLISKVLGLDCSSGATMSHAINFVSKSPLLKPYLFKYDIINLTFRYSGL